MNGNNTYIDYLTPEERLFAMRIGAMKKLASYGIGPSQFSTVLEKCAEGGGSTFSLLNLKSLLTTAAVLGIPVGALTYAMKSALSPDKHQNKKLKSQLDAYNDIVYNYEQISKGKNEDEE